MQNVPVRHDLSHALVPASIQRRGVLSSVCALDPQQFFTGCMDKRVLLWTVRETSTDEDAPKVSIKALDVAHAASVRALAYSPSRNWLVSAAGAKLAVTDVLTGQAVVRAGKQKWASNDVFNVHFHAKDPNMLLVEVRNCVFSNDAQLMHHRIGIRREIWTGKQGSTICGKYSKPRPLRRD